MKHSTGPLLAFYSVTLTFATMTVNTNRLDPAGHDQITSGPHQHFIMIRMTNSLPEVTNTHPCITVRSTSRRRQKRAKSLCACIETLADLPKAQHSSLVVITAVTRQLVRCVTAYILINWLQSGPMVCTMILALYFMNCSAAFVAVGPSVPPSHVTMVVIPAGYSTRCLCCHCTSTSVIPLRKV